MTAAYHRRAGMSLVELLVAVAILGLLAVAVLPSFATSADSRRSRETARIATTFIAQAQGKAVGRQSPGGFGIVKTGVNAESPAIDLVPAMVPDSYRGDTPTTTATLSWPSSSNPSVRDVMDLAFSTGIDPTAAHIGCKSGDLIRFDGRGPWYEFLASASGPPFSVGLRETATVDALAGQTPLNTAWPDPGPPAGIPTQHQFEILRRPRRAGSALSLGDGRCLDVFWSAAGSVSLNVAFPAADPAPTIYVLFDSAGAVRQVVADSNRFSPDGPILLLLGRVDRAGQPPVIPLPPGGSDDSSGANWQHADSTWLIIDPLSGVCRSAPCDAVAAAQPLPANTNLNQQQEIAWRLLQSQNLIRSEFTAR